MATRYPHPLSTMVSVRDAMDRLLNQTFGGPDFETIWPATRSALPLDVYTTDDEVVVLAAIPGVDPDALQISVEKDSVTIQGTLPNVADAENTKQARWHLHELPHGQFQRTLRLPIDVDASKAEATFDQGMLRLTLPKADATKPRQIQIQVGSRKNGSEPSIADNSCGSGND